MMQMKVEGVKRKSLEIVKHKLPRDREELFNFIQTQMRNSLPHLPRWAVIKGHDAALDFIADSYFEETTDCVVLANRHGVKTISFALLAFLDLTHKNISIATVGAIQPQAKRSYEYTQNFCMLFPELIKKSLMSETRTKGGGILEIVTGTISGVNSPHPVKAHLDEIELMPWTVLQEALSMTASHSQYRSAVRLTSTRKRRFGPMERMLKEAPSRGFKIYKWNIWDVIEPCSDERSGKKVVDYRTLDEEDIQVFDGCITCPLVDVCRTKAKYSDGFYSIIDTINKYKQLDTEVWNTQWECSEPGKEASIYTHLSEEEGRNVGNYPYNPSLPTYVGQDFNFAPMVSIAFQVDGKKAYVIDTLYLEEFGLDRLAKGYYQDWVKKYKVITWWCDPSEPTMIETLKGFGIPAKAAPRIGVWDGINLISQKINPAGQTESDFYIDIHCRQFIDEMLSYHRKTQPDGTPTDLIDKTEDHGCDGIRYGIVAIFSLAKRMPSPTTVHKAPGKYPVEVQRRLAAYKHRGMKRPRFLKPR